MLEMFYLIFIAKGFFLCIYRLPIIIAAQNKKPEIVEYLAQHRADVMIQDDQQKTLLEYAVLMGSKHLCELLLNMGAAFQINKAFLLSALYGKYEIFQLFLENNADTSVVSAV